MRSPEEADRSAARLVAITAVLLLTLGALSGCLGGSPDPAENETPSATPDDPRAPHPGDRPHVHDFWSDAERLTLLDGTVQVQNPQDQTDTSRSLWRYVNCQISCDPYASIGLAEGTIVPPGTDRIVVNASWSEPEAISDPGPDGLLAYQRPSRSSFTETSWKASPGSWTINLTADWTDDPHAQYSLWRFRLYPCRCYTYPHEDWEFDVDVEITAYRIDEQLSKQPAHPDWWANRSVREVHSANGTLQELGFGQTGVRFPGFTFGGFYMDRVNRTEHAGVPPGSQMLVARFNWTNEAASDASEPVPRIDWNNKDRWNRWEPEETRTGSYHYVLPLDDRMVDGMYGERSRWQFRYGFTGGTGPTPEQLFGPSVTGPYLVDGEWSVTIEVLETPESVG